MNSLIITSIEQGLIFAVLAMGVFLTYKILDIADLSVEGTFPFGAFVFAKFISMGVNPIVSTLMGFCFGTLAGLLTSTLFIKLKIKPILAGILTMTILYSVNLKINGKSNIPLFKYKSIFDLGLEDKLDVKVKFLSGGQRQSLSLIMAAMKHPDLLLLDEHTAALDHKTSHVIMKKTKELIDKYSITTIRISHNMRDAIEYSDRIIMLDKGKVVFDKPSKNIHEKELITIYRNKFNEIVA